jgi:primase-polymerase (primpol)-like protein
VSPKPQSPRPIDPRTLPALEPLTHHARWVGWQWVYNVEKDKWTKPPYKVSGANASTTDPSTWSGFDAIWRSNGRFDGLGFNLFECSPTVLAAVDLDKVRNPETGEILPWAKAVAAASYCEITPSGEGLRLLGKATLPPIHRNIKQPPRRALRAIRQLQALHHDYRGCARRASAAERHHRRNP